MNTIDVLVWIAFLLSSFFTVYYLFWAEWYENSPGRSFMAFQLVVSLVLGLAAFRRIGYLPPPWVGVLAYSLIIVTLLGLDVSLVKTQSKQRRRIRREKRAAQERTELMDDRER